MRSSCNHVTGCRCWLWKLGRAVLSSWSGPYNSQVIQTSSLCNCLVQLLAFDKGAATWNLQSDQLLPLPICMRWKVYGDWVLYRKCVPIWAYSCRETERMGLDQGKGFKSTVQSSSEDSFPFPWVGGWQKRARGIIPVPAFSTWLASCSSTFGFSITKGNHIFLIWFLLTLWKKTKSWGSHEEVPQVWVLWTTVRTK